MNNIRTAAACINTTALDWEGNKQKILQCVREAASNHVEILCLPELCITGYGCEDMFLSPSTREMANKVLHEIIAVAPNNMVLAIGLPLGHKGAVYNVVATIAGGKLLGYTAKQHLAGDGVHYENRQFKEWPAGVVGNSNGIPIGDIFFEIETLAGKTRIGYEICEDAWAANRPGSKLAQSGVDIILNPSASHFAFDKIDTRERFVIEGSRAFNCGYIYANLIGNEAGRIVYDGGAMIAATGSIIAKGPRLFFKDSHITYADISLYAIRQKQANSASRHPYPGVDNNCFNGSIYNGNAEVIKYDLPKAEIPNWEKAPNRKYEEFSRAIALGLYHYMIKSKTNGFTISLSGGADSTAVACLVRLMHKFAEEEGIKLPQLKHMLTTVYQASDNSGDVTRTAAEEIAKVCQAEHHFLNVGDIIKQYVQTVETALGRKLTWETDDITLQNIQARSRGPSVWMLANIKNQLLLATSNRSEAAVGYATMDGDTCGSISPISGISKQFLRKWLAWLEVDGVTLNAGKFAIPELRFVTAQQPTAELRPSEQTQTDEKDLMPYDVLDMIEDLAIGQKIYPDDIIIKLVEAGHSKEQATIWTEKFFRLWCRNQWKRERYAPGIHVDDKNLDPRSWCRFPILNNGLKNYN